MRDDGPGRGKVPLFVGLPTDSTRTDCDRYYSARRIHPPPRGPIRTGMLCMRRDALV